MKNRLTVGLNIDIILQNNILSRRWFNIFLYPINVEIPKLN